MEGARRARRARWTRRAVMRAWERGARARAAGGRRLGAPAHAPGWTSTASAWRTCWPRGRQDGRRRQPRPAGAERAVRALEQPPPPGLERLAPLVEGFEKLPPPVAAGGPHRHAAPLPAAGRELARLPAAARASAACSRTTWAWARRCRPSACWGRARWWCAPTSVLPNWAAELKRFRPSLKVCVYHGPGRALDEAADVTLTTYALLRLDAAVLGAQDVGHGGAGRGPGHQEPGQPGGARGVRAAGLTSGWR